MATRLSPASHRNRRPVAGSSCTWGCHRWGAPRGAAAPPGRGRQAAVPAPEPARPAVPGAVGQACVHKGVRGDPAPPHSLCTPHPLWDKPSGWAGCWRPWAGWSTSPRAGVSGPGPTAAPNGPSEDTGWPLPFCSSVWPTALAFLSAGCRGCLSERTNPTSASRFPLPTGSQD